MQVNWDATTGQGTVDSSPAGGAFQVGDIKWRSLNHSTCVIQDLLRANFGGAVAGYENDGIVLDSGNPSSAANQLMINGTSRATYVR